MIFEPGTDVIVTFKGRDHPGEVISHRRASGYVMVRIHIDPNWHYGRATWLDPEPTICVKEGAVQLVGHAK
jgi:hypothetical protein